MRDRPLSATVPSDYSAVDTQLEFLASENQKNLSIFVTDDSIDEECEETFELYVSLIDGSPPGYNTAQTFTILDDDDDCK